MITAEDIQRFKEMEEDTPKKLVVIDTGQFFEIEVPADIDTEEFLDSEECRKICADKILDQTTDLIIDRVLTDQNENGIWNV